MSKLADMLPRTPWPDRLWASDHTAQPWDLSNTAGTSPPLSPSLHPLLPLLAPQTPAGSFDTEVVSSKGSISIFICFEDSKALLPPSSSQTASHQHKIICHVPYSLRLAHMQCNWYRHDRGGQRAHISRPTRLFLLLLLLLRCKFSEKDSLCFLHRLSQNVSVCPVQ